MDGDTRVDERRAYVKKGAVVREIKPGGPGSRRDSSDRDEPRFGFPADELVEGDEPVIRVDDTISSSETDDPRSFDTEARRTYDGDDIDAPVREIGDDDARAGIPNNFRQRGTTEKSGRPDPSSTEFGLPVDVRRTSPKIGQILSANGKLREGDVEEVLRRQEQRPDERFGEIAVAGRLVSQKDVNDALASQFGFSTAVAPDYAIPPDLVTAHSPFSPFAEALRGLRSQLMLRWFDGSPQQGALAITSVDRGDGKSFICANLAVVFSQLGEKTLIIDADLRNSTLHKKFGLPNRMGLSGILSGRAGVEEILSVQGLPNLAVLPAGPIPPNPQELLGREEFSRFLNAMAGSFDVILIDTPSAQQASDAQVVAQRARAALIVGRKDKTKSAEIAQLGGVISAGGVKILGATLNEY